jgi:putative endonuclease
MLNNTKDYGAIGEELAAKELIRQGFSLLCRNYRKKTGEIDIIVQKDGVTYFVEVKAKHYSDFSPPADSVTPKKRKHIADTAAYWFAEHGESKSSFFVAEVDLSTGAVAFIDDFLC